MDGVYIAMDADQILETELNFYLVNLPNKLMDNWIARVAFRQQAVYELLSCIYSNQCGH